MTAYTCTGCAPCPGPESCRCDCHGYAGPGPSVQPPATSASTPPGSSSPQPRATDAGYNVAIASFVARYVQRYLPNDLGYGDRTIDNPDGITIDMPDLRTIRVRVPSDRGPRYFRIRVSEEL